MNKIKIYKSLAVAILCFFVTANVMPVVVNATPYETKNPLQRDGGFLLIPDSSTNSVGMYSPYDGTYLGDLIVDDNRLGTPINAIKGPDGNIYLSDQIKDSVFVYDPSGNYLYTYADSSDVIDNIRGISFRGNELFISNGGTGGGAVKCIARFTGPHNRTDNFIEGVNPFDILFLSDGRSLVADIDADQVQLFSVDGTLESVVFSVNFPEQIQIDTLLPGQYLNAAFSDNVITDFDIDGSIHQTTPFTSGRGVFRLGNGNTLATSSAGVVELDPQTGNIIEVKKTGQGRFIEFYSTGPNQPPYEPSDPYPENEAVDVDVDVTLSWTGGDPDPGDFVTYDIYFGTTNPPPKIVTNHSMPQYTPEDIYYNEHYYWKIVGWDTGGLSAEGPIWGFSTLLDVTPPESNHELTGSVGENDWYTSCVTVTLEATDDVSGVEYVYYKLNEEGWTVYTACFDVCDDGIYDLLYYAIDYAGNQEPENHVEFKIDQTAPTITLTATAQNTLKTQWLFEAEVNDETSGVARVEFYVDDEFIGEATSEPWEYSYEGSGKTAQAIVYDTAGNSQMSDVVDSVSFSAVSFTLRSTPTTVLQKFLI
jgi:hypothetical protein